MKSVLQCKNLQNTRDMGKELANSSSVVGSTGSVKLMGC